MSAKYKRDTTKSLEEQYQALEAHHITETTKLIKKLDEARKKSAFWEDHYELSLAEIEQLKETAINGWGSVRAHTLELSEIADKALKELRKIP